MWLQECFVVPSDAAASWLLFCFSKSSKLFLLVSLKFYLNNLLNFKCRMFFLLELLLSFKGILWNHAGLHSCCVCHFPYWRVVLCVSPISPTRWFLGCFKFLVIFHEVVRNTYMCHSLWNVIAKYITTIWLIIKKNLANCSTKQLHHFVAGSPLFLYLP